MALTDKLIAIANAIRGKTGKTDGLTLDQMVTEIEGIQSGGGEVYQSRTGVMYTPIFSTGDMPFSTMDAAGNLLRYADKLIEATFPNWTSVQGGRNTSPLSESSVQRAYFPKLSSTTTYIAENCPNLVEIVLGGIGYPVRELYGRTLWGSTNNEDLVVTVYVDAATLADIPTTVSGSLPGSATNATVVYRNSTTGEVITE